MPRVTGPAVVAAFLTAIAAYGPPAATLTDNGAVYTARFTGGRNAFEYHDINPNRDYWPNNRRNPGRWPGLP
jgi:hypothetical protein